MLNLKISLLEYFSRIHPTEELSRFEIRMKIKMV